MPCEKIAIAVSGGVDSLVTTCLLKQAGHEVKGFHFITGFEFEREANLAKIKALYEKLDVALEVLNFSLAFKNKVVDYFTRAYSSALTPNPCMVCNPNIKFGLLLEHVLNAGFDKLATGHYARVGAYGDRFCLYKGVDKTKDQSYFLALLNQRQLGRVAFPLGGFLKSEVKAMAGNFGVEPIHKDESQDICFIKGDYVDFLTNRMGFAPEKGPVIRRDGTVIGEHYGLYNFTVGQRRGINVPAAQPYYVLELRPEHNALVVGFAEEMGTRSFYVHDVNWIAPKRNEPFTCNVKVRYRSKEAACNVTPQPHGRILIELHEPQNAVSPGQGAVLYDGDCVICGGFIS